jgi:NAD(P)H dehydrogenase (quinone)
MATVDSEVLVFGATGTQGEPVVRRLREAGRQVRALVRSKEKGRALDATLVEGSLDDAESLVRAAQGAASAVVLLSSAVPPATLLVHARHALEAVKTAKVPHVVVGTTSVLPTRDLGVEAPDARRRLVELIERLVPHAVVVSPTLYLENFSVALRPALAQGVIPQAIPGKVPVAYLSLDDHARFVAAAIARPSLAGRRFALAGAEALAGARLATILGAALGRTLSYVALPPAGMVAQLTPLVGAQVAAAIGEMYEGGEGSALLDPPQHEVRAALGVTPTSVEAWAQEALR